MVLDKPILSSQEWTSVSWPQVVVQTFQIAQVLNQRTFGWLPHDGRYRNPDLTKPVMHIVGLPEHLEQELKLLIGVCAVLRLLRLMEFLGSYQPTRKIHLNLIRGSRLLTFFNFNGVRTGSGIAIKTLPCLLLETTCC